MPTGPAKTPAPTGPHSSRGPGHRPLKAEITGSNPVCGTNLDDVIRPTRPRIEPVVGPTRLIVEASNRWPCRHRRHRVVAVVERFNLGPWATRAGRPVAELSTG